MFKAKRRPGSKSAAAMAKASLDNWLRSPRTVLFVIFTVAQCYVQSRGFLDMSASRPQPMRYLESLFYLLGTGGHLTRISLLFLITVSEIPRRIGFQNLMLIRGSRARWLLSQVSYCLWLALLMTALVALLFSVFLLPAAGRGPGFSETALIAADILRPEEALVPEYVRLHFIPFTACLAALAPLALFWFTMVLLILLCGLMGAPRLGVVLYAFLLVLHMTLLDTSFIPFTLPLPAAYATLLSILSGEPGKEGARLARALAGYTAVIAIFAAALFARVRRADLLFSPENRF